MYVCSVDHKWSLVQHTEHESSTVKGGRPSQGLTVELVRDIRFTLPFENGWFGSRDRRSATISVLGVCLCDVMCAGQTHRPDRSFQERTIHPSLWQLCTLHSTPLVSMCCVGIKVCYDCVSLVKVCVQCSV